MVSERYDHLYDASAMKPSALINIFNFEFIQRLVLNFDNYLHCFLGSNHVPQQVCLHRAKHSATYHPDKLHELYAYLLILQYT